MARRYNVFLENTAAETDGLSVVEKPDFYAHQTGQRQPAARRRLPSPLKGLSTAALRSPDVT